MLMLSPHKVLTLVRSFALSLFRSFEKTRRKPCVPFAPLNRIICGSKLSRLAGMERGGGRGRGGDVRLPPPSELSGCGEELIAADQTKWTPAPRRAPVCLRRSEQSEHAADKWMHFLCPRLGLGSLRLPHYSHYSAACGLSNAPPWPPPLTGLRFGRGLDSFFQGHFINNPVCPVPGGWRGGGGGLRVGS